MAPVQMNQEAEDSIWAELEVQGILYGEWYCIQSDN